jgi:hypothetical protein
MKVGTKSILFGAHCFFLHPWFVAVAWWRIFGFPWDPRLWVAFFMHDIGYLGKPNMDGEEGEWHPAAGASIMAWLFDYDAAFASPIAKIIGPPLERIFGRPPKGTDWYQATWYTFCFYHSRFLAKRYGIDFSPLCVADKFSICLTPAWLYLPMVRLSGEIYEYMKHADSGKYQTMNIPTHRQKDWYVGMQTYLAAWVKEHQGGKSDSWTPKTKEPRNDEGVWK